jgi:hypothetical protein
MKLLSCAWRLTIQGFNNGAGGFDFLKCQTFAASPAEPGELLFWFRSHTPLGLGLLCLLIEAKQLLLLRCGNAC